LIKNKDKIMNLPLLLDNQGLTYKISNKDVFLINSDAENIFAKKFNIKSIDADIYSLLKPHGKFRVAVPDFDNIILEYADNLEEGLQEEEVVEEDVNQTF